jgi:hypothetical protein
MIANVFSLILLLAFGGGVLILGVWIFLHFLDD